jgi:ACS family hexuronate transporter-like MFS transporter
MSTNRRDLYLNLFPLNLCVVPGSSLLGNNQGGGRGNKSSQDIPTIPRLTHNWFTIPDRVIVAETTNGVNVYLPRVIMHTRRCRKGFGAEETNLRWRIAILVSAAIAISYLDRQTLPVAVQAISRDIPLTNGQFSALQSAFLFSYALMYAGGGKVVDLLGTRRGLTVIMLFWSLACASHALATGFAMLAASRFLLGVGEGGAFPTATRAVAEWFPTKERATAMGIINAGTAVGAVMAPPLIAAILSYANWRWIFVLTGGIGLLWAAGWRLSYAPPSTLGQAVADPILDPTPDSATSLPWIRLFRIREMWGLMTAKFLSDAAWFFYLFWLPKYLYDARGFDIKGVGTFAWMPSAAAGVGCLLGGAFSSYLVRRQFSLGVARKLALGISAAVMPFVILVPHVPVSWAIALFCLAYFGQQSWSTLVMVLPTDLFPQNVVGSVAGLVGFGGAMGGIVFGEVVGALLDRGFGYATVFEIAGTLHVAAFVIILATIPTLLPLKLHVNLSYGGVQ